MKKKDVIYLVLSVVIFLGAGYLAYTQILPQKGSSKEVSVEKVGPIPDSLDAAGLSAIGDSAQVQDFNSPVDLTTGLNNAAVFGQ